MIVVCSSSSVPRRPFREADMHVEALLCPDGESCVLWWPAAKPDPAKLIWLILPGGMTSADCFYLREAADAGVFQDAECVVFHNPGIISPVKGIQLHTPHRLL